MFSKLFVAIMVALAIPQTVQAESVSSQLKELCRGGESKMTDSAAAREARQIYEIMRDKEKRYCVDRNESYIHYLIEKYRAQTAH